eukprot:jgi/Bigna1/86112/estExt_fgenesh1_pg.C_80103
MAAEGSSHLWETVQSAYIRRLDDALKPMNTDTSLPVLADTPLKKNANKAIEASLKTTVEAMKENLKVELESARSIYEEKSGTGGNKMSAEQSLKIFEASIARAQHAALTEKLSQLEEETKELAERVSSLKDERSTLEAEITPTVDTYDKATSYLSQ